LLTFAGCLVAYFLVILVLSGFSLARIKLALQCEIRALRDPEFGAKIQALLAQSKPKDEAPPKPSGAPLRLLALLQREGRLLDFLMEDISTYADTDVGTAVRDIHRRCQAELLHHRVLQRVLPQPEHSTMQFP